MQSLPLYATVVEIYGGNTVERFISKVFPQPTKFYMHPICYVSPKTGKVWARIQVVDASTKKPAQGDWHVVVALAPEDAKAISRSLPGALSTIPFNFPVPYQLWVREFQIADKYAKPQRNEHGSII